MEFDNNYFYNLDKKRYCGECSIDQRNKPVVIYDNNHKENELVLEWKSKGKYWYKEEYTKEEYLKITNLKNKKKVLYEI